MGAAFAIQVMTGKENNVKKLMEWALLEMNPLKIGSRQYIHLQQLLDDCSVRESLEKRLNVLLCPVIFLLK
ncbi:hypothetical protein HMSSN139_05300 [Paenibacillus sp. HMSSN-139]|nr:hypothetical protein HMSSN139_05300 [Paenibacillus sp. HMSSN-139]